MPANLTAEAKAKWQTAQNAKNPREKLQALQEFLSEVPKHKGNERLRAQVKTQIAELRDEIITKRGKRGGGRSPWSIDREGAAQVVIFGPTKSGKSSLLKALTNARVESSYYEYATRYPIPGMLQYEDIQIQLVELPAPQYVSNEGGYRIQSELAEVIRRSDGLLLLVDLTNAPLHQLEQIISSLETIRISTHRAMTRVEIVPERGSGEIRLAYSGSRESLPHEQVRELLHSYGMKNALIRIFGDATIDDVEDAIFENVTLYKPTLVAANKLDLDLSREASTTFLSEVTELPTAVISSLTGQGLNTIGEQLFNGLGIVRVYTKEPSASKPSEHPFVVPGGTTVGELARSIHTDLANKYRYSRIWGPTSKFAGERVGPDHVLGDRDIVEIHTE